MPNPQAMLQAFQQLMQNPASQQAMMQGAQQMGIDPRMLMQLAGGAGGMMQGPGGGGAPMPPDMGGAGPSGEGELPPEAEAGGPPPQGTPEEMAQGQIDSAGNTWDGVDAPTKNDIERLTENPTPDAIASFNEQFGEGAAEKYLGEGAGDTGGEASEEPDASGQGNQPPEGEEY